MRKYLLSVIAVALLISGCDSSSSNNPTSPIDDGGGKTTTSGLTCLEAVGARLPGGTYAKRVSTGEKAYLDTKGCYSFKPVAARSAAGGSDSVQFYNDSALFTVTIPYVTNGDTISIVPTVISLKNCPNNLVDSVFLAVFDRVHILSRHVKMKKADFGDSSEYGRTIWSLESKQPFQIHFEVHDSIGKWPTGVISSEPGGTVTRDFKQVQKQSGLLLNVPDSLFLFTDTAITCKVDSMGNNAEGSLVSYCAGGVSYIDTIVHSNRYGLYKASKGMKITTSSPYGIVSMKVDGSSSSVITAGTLEPDTTEYIAANKVVTVSVADSAGYTTQKKVTVFISKNIWYQVSDKDYTGNPSNYTFDSPKKISSWYGSLYLKKMANGALAGYAAFREERICPDSSAAACISSPGLTMALLSK